MRRDPHPVPWRVRACVGFFLVGASLAMPLAHATAADGIEVPAPRQTIRTTTAVDVVVGLSAGSTIVANVADSSISGVVSPVPDRHRHHAKPTGAMAEITVPEPTVPLPSLPVPTEPLPT